LCVCCYKNNKLVNQYIRYEHKNIFFVLEPLSVGYAEVKAQKKGHFINK